MAVDDVAAPRTADAKPFVKPLWYWVLLVVLVAVIVLTAVPAFTQHPHSPGVEDFFPEALFGQGTFLEFNRLTLVRVVMGVALCLTVGVAASRLKTVPGARPGRARAHRRLRAQQCGLHASGQ